MWQRTFAFLSLAVLSTWLGLSGIASETADLALIHGLIFLALAGLALWFGRGQAG